MRNSQIQLFMHVKLLQKNEFVENVCPANSALFIYISTQCVETVKWLDYNRLSQLTLQCSGNASALGAKSSRVRFPAPAGFLCLMFCFAAVVFNFCPKTHQLSHDFAIPFAISFIQFTKHIARLVNDYKGIKIQTQHL